MMRQKRTGEIQIQLEENVCGGDKGESRGKGVGGGGGG